MPVIINGTTGISGVDGSAGTPSYQGTDNNTGIFYPAADTIAFAEGGTEVMRIDSSGNVGIGTNSPTFAAGTGLQVKGSGFTSVRVSAGSYTGLDISQTNTSGTSYVYLRDSAPLIFGTNNTERMRITSGGDVGIGTSSPAYKLHVDLDGTSSKYSYLINSAGTIAFQAYGPFGTAHLRLTYPSVVDWDVLVNSSGALTYSYNSAERMRLDSSGNVLVGTTTSNAGSNGFKLAGPIAVTGTVGITGNYTVGASDTWITAYSLVATCTVTLPTPSTNTGRMLFIRTQSNFAVNSASANVTTLASGGTTTSILTATAGKWALLFCDGAYWNIFAAN